MLKRKQTEGYIFFQETGTSQPFIIGGTDRRERHFQENRSSRPAIFIAQTDSYSNDGKSDHLNSMYLGCADTRILGFHENSTSPLEIVYGCSETQYVLGVQ